MATLGKGLVWKVKIKRFKNVLKGKGRYNWVFLMARVEKGQGREK
jgi:hypothetical protein